MNELREQIGLPPVQPRAAAPVDEFAHFGYVETHVLALEPRIIQAEPMVLRPAAPKAKSVARDLLAAAIILIPNQPTTEQWQTLKQAILDL